MKFSILAQTFVKYGVIIGITVLLTAQYYWHPSNPSLGGSQLQLPARRRASTNCSKPAQDATFALFILVSHKHLHYRHLIESLTRSDLPRSTSIFISHDANDAAMLALSEELRQTFTRTSIVLHPFTCNATIDTMQQQHDGFPRFDPSGKELSNWAWSCAKNHWVWAMNRVWNYYPRLQWLLYLEEDFVVSLIAQHPWLMLCLTAETLHLMSGLPTGCQELLPSAASTIRARCVSRLLWHHAAVPRQPLDRQRLLEACSLARCQGSCQVLLLAA